MSGEEWRPVAGFVGLYDVSSFGRVRSLDREVVFADGRRRLFRGVVLEPYCSGDYPTVRLSRDGRKRTRAVHVLVAEAFHGPRPAGLEVRHLDGDPLRPWADNLAYGTPAENRADMTRHGRDYQRAKTQCTFGHPLVTPNLVAWHARLGRRACLACNRGRSAVRKAAGRGVVLSLQQVSNERFTKIMEAA